MDVFLILNPSATFARGLVNTAISNRLLRALLPSFDSHLFMTHFINIYEYRFIINTDLLLLIYYH